jgi:hypothetical protein
MTETKMESTKSYTERQTTAIEMESTLVPTATDLQAQICIIAVTREEKNLASIDRETKMESTKNYRQQTSKK